jgi:hypothetical protein
MNPSDTIPIETNEATEPAHRGDPARSMHRLSPMSDAIRMAELESENFRLHRLVAELLIKNQQLRRTD